MEDTNQELLDTKEDELSSEEVVRVDDCFGVISFEVENKVFIILGENSEVFSVYGGISGLNTVWSTMYKMATTEEDKANILMFFKLFKPRFHEINDLQELLKRDVIRKSKDFEVHQIIEGSSLRGGLCQGRKAMSWHMRGQKPVLATLLGA